MQLPEIPLLFVAPIVGGLWVLVLLFAIIKAICDHRDGKELTKLQDLYNLKFVLCQKILRKVIFGLP